MEEATGAAYHAPCQRWLLETRETTRPAMTCLSGGMGVAPRVKADPGGLKINDLAVAGAAPFGT